MSVEHCEPDATVVLVRGTIDMASAPQLRGWLDVVTDQPQGRVVVDLLGVDFMDSQGLGVLLRAHQRAAAGGATLELVCASASMRKVFRVTGLDRRFVIHGSRLEAETAGAPELVDGGPAAGDGDSLVRREGSQP